MPHNLLFRDLQEIIDPKNAAAGDARRPQHFWVLYGSFFSWGSLIELKRPFVKVIASVDVA
jgi:hypothetical protein